MSQAIKVGFFVLVCLAVFGFLLFKVEGFRLWGSEGQRVEVAFDSVAGLNAKAPVRVAGVKVGMVEKIELAGRKAKVTLLLDQPIAITEGTKAAVTNAGILGDKYVDLIPGEPAAPKLAAGTVIEGTSPITFDSALARFDQLGQSLQQLTGDLSGDGEMGASIRRLVGNLEATSADIRTLVAANRGQVDSMLANFERFSRTLADELPVLTAQMQRTLEQVEGVVAENRGDLRGTMENVKQATENIQTSIDNLNAISTQIKSGEGTIGKLIYDSEAHDSLVSTLKTVEGGVGSLTQTLGRMQKIELQLALEAASYPDVDDSGSSIDLRLSSSNPNRFYRFGGSSNPGGKLSTETRTITTTYPDGRTETTVVMEDKVEDKFTLNAQVGWQYKNFELRAGLFESSGGAAIDYGMLGRKLIVSLEAFDFSRPEELDPHLRFSARWALGESVYLLGGYDDPLVSDRQSVFFGAGVRWKDDDLKYLLGSIPSF
jgi:phospholipid/cholesterol/gamma-HCH transport system substrate-binding protein